MVLPGIVLVPVLRRSELGAQTVELIHRTGVHDFVIGPRATARLRSFVARPAVARGLKIPG